MSSHDALKIVTAQPQQLKQTFDFRLSTFDCQSIVLAGMGGSALSGEFIKCWLGDKLPIPLVIIRDYNLPGFVGKNTLVVASSYSGNTEETLAAAHQAAKERKAQIVVMASGGQLIESAEQHSHPVIKLPAGHQPRLAVLYGVKGLAVLLEKLGLVSGATTELEAAGDWLAQQAGQLESQAKTLADRLAGRPGVIYAGPALAVAAMKWKVDFNENAKQTAFYNYYPEFNHNEFQGWLNPQQDFSVVHLLSNLDNPQIQRRMEISPSLVGKMPKPIEVKAEGETRLQQLLWTILLGDFVSIHLAFLNKVDPIPVDLIEKLKQELRGE